MEAARPPQSIVSLESELPLSIRGHRELVPIPCRALAEFERLCDTSIRAARGAHVDQAMFAASRLGRRAKKTPSQRFVAFKPCAGLAFGGRDGTVSKGRQGSRCKLAQVVPSESPVNADFDRLSGTRAAARMPTGLIAPHRICGSRTPRAVSSRDPWSFRY